MLIALRRLILGFILLAAASALLLFSDLGSRVTADSASGSIARIAVLQHASQPILDQGREGMMAGLAERGWNRGANLEVRNFNAEGDMPVAQAIAREMVNADNRLLMTISTPSLQAVANANRNVQIPHVFALVTDPVAAGVGIQPGNALDHPAWLAGYGTMQPIAKAFAVAREMNPSLQRVGVVWNAAEANSEAQIKVARALCANLGIQLLEASIENTAGVAEAAASLTARGAEALWVNGDVTVITAIDSVIAAANKANIPVFTVIPPNVKRGALFDLGADYYEVGRLAGVLAGDILSGRDPATVPIENVLPEMQTLNLAAAEKFKPRWTVSPELRARARLTIRTDGTEELGAALLAPVVPNPGGKKWKIAVVLYTENPPAEEAVGGMKAAWQASPLVAGKDYEVKFYSAQGDMAALGGIYDAALTDGANLFVPVSTPSLQAALHKIKTLPVVFTVVANPIIAGAGKSYTDHRPNITGISVLSPYEDMLDLLEQSFPKFKRLGTLFCPSEANSVDLKDAFAELCRQRGFTLETVAANSPTELPDAAISLMTRPIDAVVQISDNLSTTGFVAVTRAARQAKKPLFSLNSTTVPLGAAVSLGRDYHDAGEATVRLIEKIIGGQSPANIPFKLPPKVVRMFSPANATATGFTLPEALLQTATK